MIFTTQIKKALDYLKPSNKKLYKYKFILRNLQHPYNNHDIWDHLNLNSFHKHQKILNHRIEHRIEHRRLNCTSSTMMQEELQHHSKAKKTNLSIFARCYFYSKYSCFKFTFFVSFNPVSRNEKLKLKDVCNAKQRIIGMFFLLLGSSALAQDAIGLSMRDDFNTGLVASSSVNIDPFCLDYCVKGICVYLVCTPFGCTTEYRAWVEHRLPDLVVTSYNEPGSSPWTEMRSLYGGVSLAGLTAISASVFGFPLVGGGQNQSMSQTNFKEDEKHTGNALKFKEVQAIGNPFVNIVAENASDYLCTSETDAFSPYFSSELDGFTWRTGTPELLYPQTYIPGLREITRSLGFFQTWGSIYPRHGFLISDDDTNSAAVMASRAIDVITRTEQPHIYRKPPIGASDEKIDRWQMLYPTAQMTCNIFGDLTYSETRQAPYGGYGWLYWAKHDCCLPAPGVVIAKIEFSEPICTE